MKLHRFLIVAAILTATTLGLSPGSTAAQTGDKHPPTATTASMPIRLTERDVKTASEVLKILQTGRQEEIPVILNQSNISLDRLEQVLSAVHVLLAEMKMEGIGAKARPGVAYTAAAQQAEEAARNDIEANIKEQFGGRTKDYSASRKLVQKYRGDLDPFFDFLHGQDRRVEEPSK